MKELGIAVSAQDHLYLAAPSMAKYWGRARADQVTPVRTFLEQASSSPAAPTRR